ncbi:MAG: hypothetical protein GC164_02365 [Phycisphaera sp.]|nr:hypothetical protein [Phycisphaera sp.]
MTPKRCVLSVGGSVWRLAIITDENVTVETVASDSATGGGQLPDAGLSDALRGVVEANACEDAPTVLAIPSSWSLCAVIDTAGLERSGRRKAMGYLLEEQLPLSTENFVADYLDLSAKGSTTQRTLGVCAAGDRLKGAVVAAERAGLLVEHICPFAMLTGQHLIRATPGADGILIRDHEGSVCDLLAFTEGRPAAWRWLPDDTSLSAALQEWVGEVRQESHLVTTGFAGDLCLPEGHCVRTTQHAGDDAMTLAAKAGADVLRGDLEAWIDLRRDALAAPRRRALTKAPMFALVVAMVLFMLSVMAVAQWRGRAYAVLANSFGDQQAELYKKTFPDQRRVPAYIAGRMESEMRRYEGLGGAAMNTKDDIPLQLTPALDQLATVLQFLPANVRYRITDISIDTREVRVEGMAKSFADAEKIAIALRASGWYDVDAPRTQTLKQDVVSFAFTAKRREARYISRGQTDPTPGGEP